MFFSDTETKIPTISKLVVHIISLVLSSIMKFFKTLICYPKGHDLKLTQNNYPYVVLEKWGYHKMQTWIGNIFLVEDQIILNWNSHFGI